VKGHTKAVLDVDYGGSRGGTLLASCSSDLTNKLWDPSDEYKNIRTLPGDDHSVSAVRFISSGAAGSPISGNLLVSASRDKSLRIWDVSAGYCVKTIRGHADWVRDVSLHLIDDSFYLRETIRQQGYGTLRRESQKQHCLATSMWWSAAYSRHQRVMDI
jgi:WD40 repeat protein